MLEGNLSQGPDLDGELGVLASGPSEPGADGWSIEYLLTDASLSIRRVRGDVAEPWTVVLEFAALVGAPGPAPAFAVVDGAIAYRYGSDEDDEPWEPLVLLSDLTPEVQPALVAVAVAEYFDEHPLPPAPDVTKQYVDEELAKKSPLGHTHDAASLVGLNASLVGLGNVDNTRDSQKPVSVAQAAALAGKAPTTHTHTQSQVDGLTAALAGKAQAIDVQVFEATGGPGTGSTNHVWTKPAGVKLVHVRMVAGGSGGGSGMAAAAGGATSGGGGGAAGSTGEVMLPAALLPDTVPVRVGVAGKGGEATSTTTSNAGTNGGQSAFGSLIVNQPTNGGAGGRGGAAAAGASGQWGFGQFAQAPSGGSSASGAGGAAGGGGSNWWPTATGGGAGGGINTASVGFNGGNGGTNWVTGTSGSPGGSSALAGGVGTDGFVPTGGLYGGGGGGGGSNGGRNGGNGGRGVGYGAGGGGGASAVTPFVAGAGGDGGPGIVIVSSFS